MRLSVCSGWQCVPPNVPDHEDYLANPSDPSDPVDPVDSADPSLVTPFNPSLRRTIADRRLCRTAPRTHIAAALGLAMLLACSLASRPTQARAPWQNPCGTSVALAPMASPARQPRPNRTNNAANAARTQDFDWTSPSMDGGKSWSLRNVRKLIRIAKDHLRHRKKHIHQVYASVKVLTNKYSFDWLPQEQIPWYRSEITCLDRDTQAALVLPVLRSALQNFSATFVELQKARRWTIDSQGNRSLIIGELANHVERMLCEVETAMQDRSLTLPVTGLPPDGLAGVEPSRLNPDPDETSALIQDWGVVSAYTNALHGWALILRELGHAPKIEYWCRILTSADFMSLSTEQCQNCDF
ncbi:uncharacterized protein LOC117641063 [Thrips palmi]|uniref:Uncharacterized protein LOC117641063 n=1 Tax=Thrips palmi TaxID=161013 RepID=A0A6P8Y3H6_THRPL|nr:uncharacterized protein LOC117641063 [Thrips palmi]